ncbi:TPA: hypothetical protein ACPJ16_002940 [Vibrio alginolyticus]|uniref:hypothetical protein n=1 Tax=Vibrio alginolyticus TaxID=663 RepID=UPI00215C8BB5|nr:hypothetical protein [Vibrio alginolyticus]EGQ8984615.1 hypothetical protein [Vibrio alginolyticus]ELB2736575.1 hypothetical protein [Vibrio alginolyticus]ELB2758690.1 hypothetical protein [Vibrio alginolyticus]MCR9597486.1 hypothetical protein [Vibrio alginolyticus]MCR9601994.1 hypothetical protein [Vibrio alginolyticus]
MPLDKLSLDEMVQGRNRNTDDWKELVKDPERERVWSEAVRRREHLDQFCYFVAKWPHFVRYYQQAKCFVKQSINSPIVSLMRDDDLLGALALSLNDTDKVQEQLLITVEWGNQQLIEIQGEQTVSFNTESQVQIHYRYEGLEGWITSDDKWEFSPDEGAVMLTFIHGDVISDDLTESLNKAKSVGYIVLLPLLK